MGRGYQPSAAATPAGGPQGTVTDGKGFLVIIEGYTPYEKVGELMDPAGVGNDKSKWGIVTRLANLNDAFDGNSPFQLLLKDKIEHFKCETSVVDLADARMPLGIGVQQVKSRITKDQQQADSARGGRGSAGQSDSADRVAGEQVLIDPLTREEISKTFDLDEKGRKKYDTFNQPVYIERDRWFRIKAKFLWKNASPSQGQPPARVPGGIPGVPGGPPSGSGE